MCQGERGDSCCCENPEKLKAKPQDCTPEQIKECHGEAREHSCAKEKK